MTLQAFLVIILLVLVQPPHLNHVLIVDLDLISVNLIAKSHGFVDDIVHYSKGCYLFYHSAA